MKYWARSNDQIPHWAKKSCELTTKNAQFCEKKNHRGTKKFL